MRFRVRFMILPPNCEPPDVSFWHSMPCTIEPTVSMQIGLGDAGAAGEASNFEVVREYGRYAIYADINVRPLG